MHLRVRLAVRDASLADENLRARWCRERRVAQIAERDHGGVQDPRRRAVGVVDADDDEIEGDALSRTSR